MAPPEGLARKIVVVVAFVLIVVAIVLIAVFVRTNNTTEEPTPPKGPPVTKKIVFLHFSDFYAIEGTATAGGLARFVSIVKNYLATENNVVITFGGDLFSPSSMSTFLGGPFQMIEGFNYLSNLTALVSVVGNHELDNFTSISDNIKAFKSPWLLANLLKKGTNQPIDGVHSTYVLDVDGIKIGFIGLGFDFRTVTLVPEDALDYVNYTQSAEEWQYYLRNTEEVSMVIALTHMPWDDEKILMTSVLGIDLCLAGHDHANFTDSINNHYLLEGYLELQQVIAVTVFFEDKALKNVSYQYILVNNNIPKDPDMQNITDKWLSTFTQETKIVVGNTLVDLIGANNYTRCKETNTGNYVTDALRKWATAALKDVPVLPIIGVINSGGLRWTADVYANTNLTKGSVLSLLPFGNTIAVIQINGSDLRLALEHSVAVLPSVAGAFLQVSGFKFNVDCTVKIGGNGTCYSPVGSRVSNITLTDGTPIQDTDKFYLATNNYLQGGGDVYTMFVNRPLILDPENTVTVFDALIEAVKESYYISPSIEGRIIEVIPPPIFMNK